MATHSVTRYRQSYLDLWAKAKVRPDDVRRATTAAEKLLALAPRYKKLEDKTGVPWYAIALIHMRECNNNFKGVLHNGELIVGTGKRTKLVPAGRGPFKTFEESAVDALEDYKGAKWDVPQIAFICEKFNGFGYRGKGIPSPYLWAASTVQKAGKYVRDHVYDANHWDTQLGTMTVFKRLCELDAEVAARVDGGVMIHAKPAPAPVNGAKAPAKPPAVIPPPAPLPPDVEPVEREPAPSNWLASLFATIARLFRRG